MTVHAEDVPLSEVLDYVSRNLGVSFYVGDNVLWATPREDTRSPLPLETRMYRLRKGDPDVIVRGSGEEMDTDADTDREGHELLLEAITRFVPQPEGADFLFNRNAHVLIVRNTRSNLRMTEEILEALDVSPPQVLIEARFINVRVDNLRELGIDWILNSPYVISKKTVLEDGVPVERAHTQIRSASAPAPTFYPDQGFTLSFTYEGILTDPMFKAVLQALEASGKARALSVPRVTTVNNHKASIHVGENFLYFRKFRTVQRTNVSYDDSGRRFEDREDILVPDGEPTEVPLGITLNVIPSVGADMQSITLALNPHIESFVRYETWAVDTGRDRRTDTDGSGVITTTNEVDDLDLLKLPIFKENDIRTKVIVRSGETVVMGGVITSSEVKQEREVPVLASIPLVGRLFRHTGVERIDENLLIFLTATILSERGENLIPIIDYPLPSRE
jgi:type IV pilus assembly protein PilQ